MDLTALGSAIAQGVSARFGGPYVAGAVLSETPPVMSGGSIVTPGTPIERVCMVQIDDASWQMRQSEDYVEGSMLCLILADTLDGALDTDARLRVDAGPHVGEWLVSGIKKDTMGIYWQGVGVVA